MAENCGDRRTYTEGTQDVVFPFVRREEVELGVVTAIAIIYGSRTGSFDRMGSVAVAGFSNKGHSNHPST